MKKLIFLLIALFAVSRAAAFSIIENPSTPFNEKSKVVFRNLSNITQVGAEYEVKLDNENLEFNSGHVWLNATPFSYGFNKVENKYYNRIQINTNTTYEVKSNGNGSSGSRFPSSNLAVKINIWTHKTHNTIGIPSIGIKNLKINNISVGQDFVRQIDSSNRVLYTYVIYNLSPSDEIKLEGDIFRGVDASNVIGNQAENNIIEMYIGSFVPPFPNYVVVDDSWTGLSNGTVVTVDAQNYTIGYDAFETITKGVNAVNTNGTVRVLAGNYPESFTVSKSMTLFGAGIDASNIIVPNNLPNQGNFIVFDNNAVVNFYGFTVKGPGPSGCQSISKGIYVKGNANVNIHDNKIMDIRDNPFSGCQSGIAIQVGRKNESTIVRAVIQNNIIIGYQKGGIVVDNAGSYASIVNNTILGAGPTVINAQNGIQISRNAMAELINNNIQGNSYIKDDSFKYGATGILLYQSGAISAINGNTISNNDNNLYSYDAGQIILGANTFGLPAAPIDYGNYIVNYSNFDINASLCTFNGKLASSMTKTELFDLERFTWHAIDGSDKPGLVWYVPNNVYVPIVNTIQNAIDAVPEYVTINIQNGNYTENLKILQAVTLLGESGTLRPTLIGTISELLPGNVWKDILFKDLIVKNAGQLVEFSYGGGQACSIDGLEFNNVKFIYNGNAVPNNVYMMMGEQEGNRTNISGLGFSMLNCEVEIQTQNWIPFIKWYQTFGGPIRIENSKFNADGKTVNEFLNFGSNPENLTIKNCEVRTGSFYLSGGQNALVENSKFYNASLTFNGWINGEAKNNLFDGYNLWSNRAPLMIQARWGETLNDNIDIHHNTFQNILSGYSFFVLYDPIPASADKFKNINLHHNKFLSNSPVFNSHPNKFYVKAENNYWNDPSGPKFNNGTIVDGGNGTEISAGIDFAPFFTNPTLTVLSNIKVDKVLQNGVFDEIKNATLCAYDYDVIEVGSGSSNCNEPYQGFQVYYGVSILGFDNWVTGELKSSSQKFPSMIRAMNYINYSGVLVDMLGGSSPMADFFAFDCGFYTECESLNAAEVFNISTAENSGEFIYNQLFYSDAAFHLEPSSNDALLSGDEISYVNDITFDPEDARAPTISKRPKWYLEGINGMPAVKFEPDYNWINLKSDALACDHKDKISTGRTSYTSEPDKKYIFVVFKPTQNIINGEQVLFEAGGQLSGYNIYLQNGTLVAGMWNSVQTRFITMNTPGLIKYDDANIVCLMYDGTQMQLYFNGELSGALDFKGLLKDATYANDCEGVGCAANGSRFKGYNFHSSYFKYFNGFLGDVIVFNGMNEDMSYDNIIYDLAFKFNPSWYLGPDTPIGKLAEWKYDKQDDAETTGINVVPNPVSSISYFNYEINETSHAYIYLMNELGQIVANIYDGAIAKGIHEFSINAQNLSNGVYTIVVNANGSSTTGKIVVSK